MAHKALMAHTCFLGRTHLAGTLDNIQIRSLQSRNIWCLLVVFSPQNELPLAQRGKMLN
jgi:hypothetical protein